jgi:hypothetical protein
MLDLKFIETMIADKKAILSELVKRYNEAQNIGNQLSVEILKMQGGIDSLEEIKKGISEQETKK